MSEILSAILEEKNITTYSEFELSRSPINVVSSLQ